MLTLTRPDFLVQNVIRSVAAIAAARRARCELAMMTDRELADIGLSRGAIERAAMLPAAHGIDPARGGRPPARPGGVLQNVTLADSANRSTWLS